MVGLNDKDKEFLKNNFGIMDIDEISKKLNISKSIIAKEIRALNLKKRNLKKFTEQEIEILKKHYKYLSYGELGNILKRNRTVIFSKIRELGLEKDEQDQLKYKENLSGYEDSIMFMYSNLKYSINKIKKTLDGLEPDNGITVDMINSFLFISTPEYSKNWKLFNKSI